MSRLSGKKEIVGFMGRSWPVIKDFTEKMGFPMKKIAGRWESDKLLIDEWRRDQIVK